MSEVEHHIVEFCFVDPVVVVVVHCVKENFLLELSEWGAVSLPDFVEQPHENFFWDDPDVLEFFVEILWEKFFQAARGSFTLKLSYMKHLKCLKLS